MPLAYEERPGPARRDNQTVTRIIVAIVVIVLALLAWFLFLRPVEPAVAPGNGVEVVDPAAEDDPVLEPADDVEVLEPADDADGAAAVEDADAVEVVPATPAEGASIVPRPGGATLALTA